MASWADASEIATQIGTATDTVSNLAWSWSGEQLAYGCWDGSAGVYKWSQWGEVALLFSLNLDDWILSVAWGPGDAWVAFGCTSGWIHVYSIPSGSPQLMKKFQAHAAPVSCLAFSDLKNTLVSASWDSTARYWGESPDFSCLGTIALPQRAYCMDLRKQCCVIALAPSKLSSSVALLEVGQLSIVKLIPSPLKYQLRSIALFADGKGFLLASIEGRCAIVHIHDSKGDFIFKCHRNAAQNSIHAVNCIAVHKLGTFATAGGDGTYSFWDKDSRTRLKAFPARSAPITSATFNLQGNRFAFATGEDWQSGAPTTTIPTLIYYQSVGTEIKPKAKN